MIRAAARLYADAFRGLPADVWRLSAGLLINRAGTMVLPFLSLYLVRELGYEATAAGAVLLAFGLGSVAGSYIGGAIVGRFGPLRVQVGSLVLAGAGFLVLGQLRSFAAMTAGVFVVGAISDAFRPACLTAIVEVSPPAVRARAMGLMRLAANAGMAIGPAAGGALAGVDYRLIFVGEAATCLLAALWLERSWRGRDLRPAHGGGGAAAGARSPWSDGPLLGLLALVFLSTLVLFQIFSTLPLYLASDYGFDEGVIGLVFALNALLIVAFEMVLIKLLEDRDPVFVMAVGLFLMCAGFGLLPFGRGVLYAAFAVTVLSVGEMLALPFSNLLVARRAGAGGAGQLMGMYSATFSVSIVVAPALGMLLLDRFGGLTLWLAAGLMGPLVFVLTLLLAPALRAPRAA